MAEAEADINQMLEEEEDDYYKVLNVAPTATLQIIKESYRRLALQLHPDKNRHVDTTEPFQRLGRAYDELKDPERRQAFDRRRGAQIVYSNANANTAAAYYAQQAPDEPEAPGAPEPPPQRNITQISQRRAEIRAVFNSQRAFTQYSTKVENWFDPDKELPNAPKLSRLGKWLRSRKIRKWKQVTTDSFTDRLQTWATSRAFLVGKFQQRDKNIQELENILRTCRIQPLQKAQPDKFVQLFPHPTNPGTLTFIQTFLSKESHELLDIPERIFVANCIEAHYEECGDIRVRLEHERRQYEADEYAARKKVVREAFFFLGPLTKSKSPKPDHLCRKLWTMLDFIKPAIHHECSTKGNGTTEGPWHDMQVVVTDERFRVNWKHLSCGRCANPAFKMHKNCARCTECDMFVCLSCHSDLKVLAMFQDWVEGRGTAHFDIE